jgi:tetratricopeptide (TPR) repeat protein
MPVVPETALTHPQRETLKKARQADSTRNYDYALTLLQGLLREQPEFLAGRQLLRDIAIKKGQTGSKLAKSFGSFSSAPALMKAQSLLKKDPLAVLPMVEEVLANDPYNSHANNLLSSAAQAAGMLETACLAHETLAKANTDDFKNLHALGDLYLRMRDPRAKDVFTGIINRKPSDGEALTKLKDAEALGTMAQGGWDKAKDYRELIADKGAAAKLEQAAKITRSDEGLDALIAENYAAHQADPSNPLHTRRIGDLYRQREDYVSAVQWFEYTWELGGRADAGIEKILHDLRIKQLDQAIAEWEEYMNAHPGAPEQATLDELVHQRAGIVLEECRSRVAKYPNDLQFRFDLGEALFKHGDITAAIPELQAALRQPNARVKAMYYLSCCFESKGQFDIAARRLEEAASEIPGWDDSKKQIIYQLALVREKMGDKDKCLEALKQIYEVDYGYRDVAARVENPDNFPYKA